jgi:hypothetical protein
VTLATSLVFVIALGAITAGGGGSMPDGLVHQVRPCRSAGPVKSPGRLQRGVAGRRPVVVGSVDIGVLVTLTSPHRWTVDPCELPS